MQVPEVFVAWWTRHASSNVDLANLSNVNRQWRNIVVNVLLEQAEEEQVSSSSLLLLPSMLRGILTGTTAPSNHENDTFCAAWFHPSGIQIQQLGLVTGGEVWDFEGEDTTFAPSGGAFYGGSDEERPRRSRNFSSASRGRSLLRRHEEQQQAQQEGPLCSHEWQGYRHPMDVLESFGYAEHFVQVSEAGLVCEVCDGKASTEPSHSTCVSLSDCSFRSSGSLTPRVERRSKSRYTATG